jgi:hypothetical protein
MLRRYLSTFLVLVALLVACTDDVRTKSTLDQAGYTDVQTTGYAMAACSDDDQYHTGFVATNPLGNRVHGVVCCGVWKSCTIRF